MPDLTSSFQKFFNADNFKVSGPRLLTVKAAAIEDVGTDGNPQEKPVVRFVEDERGVVLNKTRYQDLAYLAGSPDTDKWPGLQVEAFFDPTVKFGAQRLGGIAFRRPAATK